MSTRFYDRPIHCQRGNNGKSVLATVGARNDSYQDKATQQYRRYTVKAQENDGKWVNCKYGKEEFAGILTLVRDENKKWNSQKGSFIIKRFMPTTRTMSFTLKDLQCEALIIDEFNN